MNFYQPSTPGSTETTPNRFKQLHPFFKLLLLIAAVLVGMLISQGISLLLIAAWYGGLNVVIEAVADPLKNPKIINPLKWLQLISSIGSFLIPALCYGYLYNGDWTSFLKLNAPQYKGNYLLTTLAILLLLPVFSYVVEWNEGLHFGPFDSYFREMEKSAEVLTKAFLHTTSWLGFGFNMVVIALSAAVCEEFLFRGTLQNLLKEWFKNEHIAIWVAAALFSLFHAQMLGFFPRMLIGAVLGYVYVWSGSIWTNVLAHFINNGLQVVLYFFMVKGYSSIDTDKTDSFGIIPTAVATLIALVVMWWMYKNRAQEPLACY